MGLATIDRRGTDRWRLPIIGWITRYLGVTIEWHSTKNTLKSSRLSGKAELPWCAFKDPRVIESKLKLYKKHSRHGTGQSMSTLQRKYSYAFPTTMSIQVKREVEENTTTGRRRHRGNMMMSQKWQTCPKQV
jgi:hypothetical protein